MTQEPPKKEPLCDQIHQSRSSCHSLDRSTRSPQPAAPLCPHPRVEPLSVAPSQLLDAHQHSSRQQQLESVATAAMCSAAVGRRPRTAAAASGPRSLQKAMGGRKGWLLKTTQKRPRTCSKSSRPPVRSHPHRLPCS